MENQEAIEELEYAIELIKQFGKDWLDERDIPVLQMAISVLQAQEAKTQLSAEGTTSDCISRQAAVDVCNYAIDLWHGQLGEGIVIAVRKRIEELPSAQPESPRTCAECENFNLTKDLNAAIYPEIIRCKDCIYWKRDGSYSGILPEIMACTYTIGATVARRSDDYCSRAERRTDDLQ